MKESLLSMSGTKKSCVFVYSSNEISPSSLGSPLYSAKNTPVTFQLVMLQKHMIVKQI